MHSIVTLLQRRLVVTLGSDVSFRSWHRYSRRFSYLTLAGDHLRVVECANCIGVGGMSLIHT
jgi:hypothetical protein